MELPERTDNLAGVQEKMQEYLNSGLRLGWLINPQKQQVEIYQPLQKVTIVELPANLSGYNILPNFNLFLPSFSNFQ